MRGKGEGSVYRVPKDRSQPLKYWTAVVELPPGPDGKRRRKPVRSKDKQYVIDQLRILQNEKAEAGGDLPTSSITVEQWMATYLAVAKQRVGPNTYAGYESASRKHIVPIVGSVKLGKLTPADVRRMHQFVIDTLGLKSTTALLAHRTLSVALKMAEREGRIPRNPAELVDAPRKSKLELEVLTLGEALDVMEYLKDDPLGAVWATSLLTAGRRGEVIGLERDRVGADLDYSWQLQRVKWEHGCSPRCKAKRGVDCLNRRHTFPADFEVRPVEGGLFLTRPKSARGWRVIPLVEPLRTMLQQHIEFTPPNPWGLVFDWNGRPLDPDDHSARWRQVLETVGIDKNVRLHDVRHTAVDLLDLVGVPDEVIQEIVGHSTRQQTRAYKSRMDRARLERAMESLSSLFSQPSGTRSGTPSTADR